MKWVFALTVLPNGNLVSGSDDATIKIWNPATRALILIINADSGVIWALTEW